MPSPLFAGVPSVSTTAPRTSHFLRSSKATVTLGGSINSQQQLQQHLKQQQQQQQQKQQQHLQQLLQKLDQQQQQSSQTHQPSSHQSQPPTAPSHQSQQQSPQTIDINTLREKSKHLDLPLISALCNDRSLLKQTKAFVMPRHPRSSLTTQQQQQGVPGTGIIPSSPKSKYPVSGLSTTQLAKPRKSSISHRHPNDKLPPLPMQTAEGNNYVMDPTPTAIKHKSYNSQPNL